MSWYAEERHESLGFLITYKEITAKVILKFNDPFLTLQKFYQSNALSAPAIVQSSP